MDLPTQSQSSEAFQHVEHLRGVPIPEFNDVKPKILIGLPHAKLCAVTRSKMGEHDQPVASKTALGWIIYGKHLPVFRATSALMIAEETGNIIESKDDQLRDLVKQLLSMEALGSIGPEKTHSSREEKQLAWVLARTMKRVGNRY